MEEMRCPNNDFSFVTYAAPWASSGYYGLTAGGLMDNNTGYARYARLVEIPEPAITPHMMEVCFNGWMYNLSASWPAHELNQFHTWNLWNDMHEDGTRSNVMFVDCHVQPVASDIWFDGSPMGDLIGHQWAYNFSVNYPQRSAW